MSKQTGPRPSHDARASAAGLGAPDRARWRGTLIALLVIAASTALVYSNTFRASFHFDDAPNIIDNQSLRDLHRLWPPSGTRYLGFLSFALNYEFGGLEVFGYHLTNLLIHVCNGLLVYWLAAITLQTPVLRCAEAGPLVRGYLPLAAGLLFAVHPGQTQAVTYIVQRFTSLATLFYLLSLVLFAQARLLFEVGRPSKVPAAVLYCLSVVAAAGAMATKEISFTLPVVAAGYEILFFRPHSRRRLLLLVPIAATAALVPLGVTSQWQNRDMLPSVSRLAAEAPEISRSVYLLTQSRVVMTYVRLLLLPVRQNLDYDFHLSHDLADPRVLFALAILLTIAACAVVLLLRARKTNRAPGALAFFGIAWFFVTLSVESSIIPIRDVINEHRMYLPSAGAVIAMGTALLWAAEGLRLRIPLGAQLAAVMLITAGPLGLATYERNFVWRDDVTLWSDVVAKSPGKARSHTGLAQAYSQKILLDQEKSRSLTGLARPDDPGGLLDKAIHEAREATRLDPKDLDAHLILGNIYGSRGQLDDAISEYREAILLNPHRAESHCEIGTLLHSKGLVGDAIREYREAIRIDPGLAVAHNNLGTAYHENGQLGDAIREYREAAQLDPTLEDARFNLELILQQGTAGSPQ